MANLENLHDMREQVHLYLQRLEYEYEEARLKARKSALGANHTVKKLAEQCRKAQRDEIDYILASMEQIDNEIKEAEYEACVEAGPWC